MYSNFTCRHNMLRIRTTKNLSSLAEVLEALEDWEDEEKSESLELVASSLSSDELEDDNTFRCLSTECDLEPSS